MGTNLFILAGLLVVIVLLGIIGILSRYRKCKSDEVLVVYGKTGGSKSAKLYHGGAAFVWPIIQGYDFLSMKPMQIDCKLTGAISAQNIRVDVPTTITVAISTDPEVMQNAAERMLGLSMDDKQNLITDVVYGQMRFVIADMTIEELNSDRDKFLAKVKDNIDTELRKFGLYLMNINISDIRDAANYIVNLGKEAESKAQNEAQANIEEQEKLGAIKIANQIKERETRVAETRKDQEVAIAATRKEQEISVAQTDKERVSQVALANADKESQVARAEAEKTSMWSRRTRLRRVVSPSLTPTWRLSRLRLRRRQPSVATRHRRKLRYPTLSSPSPKPTPTRRLARLQHVRRLPCRPLAREHRRKWRRQRL